MAILCGGGPAPGHQQRDRRGDDSRTRQRRPVIGIRDGFKWLMQGDTSTRSSLSIEDVSRIHFTGGSYLGISRANPTRDPRHLEAVVDGARRRWASTS